MADTYEQIDNDEPINGPALGNSTPNSGGRKRGRNASACTQCHARKQKCNGDKPCLNCRRRGVSFLCSGPPTSQILRPSVRKPKQSPKQVETDGEVPSGIEQSKFPLSLPRIGQLWRSRDAPAFYGSSYFGPQVAAGMLDSPAPEIPAGTGSSRHTINPRPFRDESGPFSQIWDLLGLLPRQKTSVDQLVERFFTDINCHIDAVHEASFRKSYVRFWERKSGFDDVTTVDLRWLALLFVILAIGAHLHCPRTSSPETQQDYEEASLRFYWASRRCIVIAPSFYGESTDLVRAGILITRYLIQTQRLGESWLTVGFAARLGIAQGLHISGDRWGLPRRSTETRRRLWCHLYALDRMISLALGRPYLISDAQSLVGELPNIYVDDLSDEEAQLAQPLPLTNPTISAMASLEYKLAKVIGRIQEACFQFHTASYREVLALDEQLMEWKHGLPSYFALDFPDLSLDATHIYLKWQRVYLHTSFHFARITLHRPYLLSNSLTDRYQFSREACLSSARADLKTRLDHYSSDSAEHYAWSLAAHQLFNSAIILGILAVREAKSLHASGVIEDLESYCEMQRSEMWLSEFGLAEVRVVEMCVAKLKQRVPDMRSRLQSPAASAQPSNVQEAFSNDVDTFRPLSPSNLDPITNSNWQDQFMYSTFPDYTDLQVWQDVIDSIGVEF